MPKEPYHIGVDPETNELLVGGDTMIFLRGPSDAMCKAMTVELVALANLGLRLDKAHRLVDGKLICDVPIYPGWQGWFRCRSLGPVPVLVKTTSLDGRIDVNHADGTFTYRLPAELFDTEEAAMFAQYPEDDVKPDA